MLKNQTLLAALWDRAALLAMIFKFSFFFTFGIFLAICVFLAFVHTSTCMRIERIATQELFGGVLVIFFKIMNLCDDVLNSASHQDNSHYKKFFLCAILGDGPDIFCKKGKIEAGMSTKKSPDASWASFQ